LHKIFKKIYPFSPYSKFQIGVFIDFFSDFGLRHKSLRHWSQTIWEIDL